MNVHEVIARRRSVRQYSPRAIPEEVMVKMRRALRSAPSACNRQPWRFIFVEDEVLRQEVAKASGQQLWIAQAPVIVAACGFPDQAFKFMGDYGNSVDIDLAIAVDHLTLAAAEEGLGTCWIGAFVESEVKKVLDVPAAVKIVAMTPLGYPASPELVFPLPESRRKPERELFTRNRFTGPAIGS